MALSLTRLNEPVIFVMWEVIAPVERSEGKGIFPRQQLPWQCQGAAAVAPDSSVIGGFLASSVS